MLRFFSIVTFSLVAASASLGQNYWAREGNSVVAYRVGPLQSNTSTPLTSATLTGPNGSQTSYSWRWRWDSMPDGGNIQRFVHITMGSGNLTGNYSLVVASSTGLSSPYTWSWNGTDIGDFVPPDETVDVEWKFTSEWAGSVVEVVESQGNVIATYGLPSVIGPEGYTLETTISAPDLEGAQVYLDGVPTNSLAALAASEIVTEQLDRPAYAFNFDGSYTGTSWEIRRPDGGVAASGSAASLQTVLEGRVTIGGGDQGEVFVLTPSGDGMPSQWIPTGVTLQGSTTTVHSFVNNPAAAAPEPMPTPAPVSTPVAPQPAPTNQTSSPPSVSNPTNSEDYVSVDVEPVELEDPDDGEDNVLNTIGDLQALVSGIVADMAQVQGNFVEASQVFNGLRLGGVGRNCQFSFGPASITLQTSGPVRSGLTLLMIGVAAFGAASMIRTAIQ